jgi:hypothetical protein
MCNATSIGVTSDSPLKFQSTSLVLVQTAILLQPAPLSDFLNFHQNPTTLSCQITRTRRTFDILLSLHYPHDCGRFQPHYRKTGFRELEVTGFQASGERNGLHSDSCILFRWSLNLLAMCTIWRVPSWTRWRTTQKRSRSTARCREWKREAAEASHRSSSSQRGG